MRLDNQTGEINIKEAGKEGPLDELPHTVTEESRKFLHARPSEEAQEIPFTIPSLRSQEKFKKFLRRAKNSP